MSNKSEYAYDMGGCGCEGCQDIYEWCEGCDNEPDFCECEETK